MYVATSPRSILEALEPGPAFAVTEETSGFTAEPDRTVLPSRRRFLFSPCLLAPNGKNGKHLNPIDQGIFVGADISSLLLDVHNSSTFCRTVPSFLTLKNAEQNMNSHGWSNPGVAYIAGAPASEVLLIRFLHVYLQRIHWSLGHSYV